MQDLLADEYPAFLESYQQAPITGLRLNTLKLSPDTWRSLSPYPLTPVPWCPSGFTLQQNPAYSTPPPGKHPFHAAGLYYLQDPSAMAAAELLAPQPGERVLDLAAAPGGKTTHLAALMQGEGLLVANEIHPQRAWDLAENLERCGVRNAVVLNESPARLAAHFDAIFDRVLLDAPCSGEGMFRKSAAARQEWKPGLAQSCALRQSDILTSAAHLVRPGGWLAYTTCTFAPAENEAVIERFLTAQPDFHLVSLTLSPGFAAARPDWSDPPANQPVERALRLWPHRLAGEGHFIAIIQKDEPSRTVPLSPGTLSSRPDIRPDFRLDAATRQHFATFWQQTMTSPMPETLLLSGAYLYQPVPRLPDLAGLKVLHPGWWLGMLKTGRFEPAHALALGSLASHFQHTVALDPADPLLVTYLRGGSLPIPGEPGWVCITVAGYPLGWGKRSHDLIKNAYPRGLRWPG